MHNMNPTSHGSRRPHLAITLRTAFSIIVFILTAEPAQAAPAFFRGLGQPPGLQWTHYSGLSISDDGGVVAGSLVQTIDGLDRGSIIIWERDLGLSVGPTGAYPTVHVRALSGDGGRVLGGDYFWDRDVSSLTPLSLSEDIVNARGISRDGSVIVGGTHVNLAGNIDGHNAWRWSDESGFFALGHLNGGNYSIATDVSADGRTIAGYELYGFGDSTIRQAFLWDAAHGIRPLSGDLPGDW